MLHLNKLKQWINFGTQLPLGLNADAKGLTLVGLSQEKTVNHLQSWEGITSNASLEQYIIANKLTKAPCVGVLSYADYHCYLIERPKVSTQELLAALRWRIADVSDIPLNDLVLDYFELPKKNSQAQERLYIVAAKREAIKQLLISMRQAQLKPLRIDIPECALANLNFGTSKMLQPKVLLTYGDNEIHLEIIKSGLVIFIRRFELNHQTDSFDSNHSHELALQVQRSLDYCTSTIADTSNAQIFIQPSHLSPTLQAALEEILGLEVSELKTSDEHLAEQELFFPALVTVGALLGGRSK